MNIFISILLSFVFLHAHAQGKFSGAGTSLIGKTLKDQKHIPGLNGYSLTEGTLLTPVNDPEQVLSSLYKKGNAYILLVTTLKDSIAKLYVITDVLEIKNVQEPWQIKTSTCRINENEDAMIIALVKLTNTPYLKRIKQA